MASATTHLLWKVVNTAPENFVRPVTKDEHTLRDTLVVSTHTLLAVSVPPQEILVGVNSSNRETICGEVVPMLFTPALLKTEDLMNMRVWEAIPKTAPEEYRLPPPIAGIENGELQAVVHGLLLHDEEGQILDGEEHIAKIRALDILSAAGLVRGPPWKLTPDGRDRLQLGQWYGNAALAFAPCERVTADSGTAELILRMRRDSWAHIVADSKELCNSFAS